MNRLITLRETARGRKSRAFTLTELVIVMAIIGILGVLAVFGYGRFIATSNDTVADTQAKRAATEIAAYSVAVNKATNTLDPKPGTEPGVTIDANNDTGAADDIKLGEGFTATVDANKKVTITYGGQSSCIDLSKATTVGAIAPAC